MLKHFVRAHWLLFVTLLFLTAVAMTVARLWIPVLGNYQQELEAAASKALKREVTIGKVEGTWRGMGPVLKLKKVTIKDASGVPGLIDIDEVWVRLDTRHFLAESKVRVWGVDVIGTEVGITRDADGRIYIDEFGQGADGDSFDMDEFLKMRRLSVNDSIITFTDKQSGEAPHRFSDVTLALLSDGYEHTLSGYALLPPELGYRVDVSARLYGSGSNFSKWRGNIYTKGQVLALSDLARSLLPDNLTLQGIADARVWIEYSAGRLQSVKGEFDAHDIVLKNAGETNDYGYAADAISGSLGWRYSDEGWQLALQDLTVTRNGRPWETENLSLSGIQKGAVNHLQLTSEQMQLDNIGALLSVLPGLNEEQRSQLVAMQPVGTIDELQLALDYKAGEITLDRFTADFTALAFRESGKFPSVSGLSGRIFGTPAQGHLSLFGSTVGFHDSSLFLEPLKPFEIQTDITWATNSGRLEMASENLQLENSDLALHGAFGFDMPGGDSVPSLYLELAIDNADVAQLGSYLPAVRMRPAGVAWLKKSLVSGSIEGGSVLVNGRLDQFPFDNNEGQLEVRLPVRNAVLDYNKRWSPVVGLAAQVDIDGRTMNLKSSQGVIRTALIEDVQVYIPNLVKPEPVLKGTVKGSLPAMLDELGSSPLGDSYGSFVDSVQAKGQASLKLDLDMVLHGKNKTVKTSGEIGLEDNELSINKSNIDLKEIRGTLFFDQRGISGDKLTTELYGRPAEVSVWSDAAEKATHISLNGKLGLLRRVVGEESPLYPSITGDSDWQVVLSIIGKPRRGEKANLRLHIGSMLRGTGIDLPAPLGKQAAAARELSIDIPQLEFPLQRVRLKFGEIANGLLTIAAEGKKFVLDGGAIAFGGNLPDVPPGNRLLVSGRLQQIRTTDWKPYIESRGKGLGLPVDFNLKVDELEVLRHYLDDVDLEMRTSGLVWNIKAKGPSLLGTIQLTKAGAGLDKVVMTLERLVLKSDAAVSTGQKNSVMPEAFPNLQIVAKQFTYDAIDLGNFQLTTKRKPGNTLEITRLILSSERLAARLNGLWRLQDGQQRSTIDVDISSGKMDALLKMFGFQESIRGGNLTGTLRAAWAGPPWAFSPSLFDGQINLLIENGQLVDIEPGAAGRILGLLSLSNIRRRLVLDFSDLFGEGFGFDKIEGGFVVEGGNAYTSDLYVKGPAAKIEITGRVGLAEKDYDQVVTVTPIVKSPLSLAGTLVGGPVVGAAIMVAESLLEGKIEAINKMVRTRYAITGPWSKPDIRKIETDDSSAAATAGVKQ